MEMEAKSLWPNADWLDDQCEGQRSSFLGLEEQCRLSGGGSVLVKAPGGLSVE